MIRTALGLVVLFVVVYLGIRHFNGQAAADRMVSDVSVILSSVGAWVLDGLDSLGRSVR